MNENVSICLLFFFAVASLVDSLTTPLVVAEGQDAAITCVVRNIAHNTGAMAGPSGQVREYFYCLPPLAEAVDKRAL